MEYMLGYKKGQLDGVPLRSLLAGRRVGQSRSKPSNINAEATDDDDLDPEGSGGAVSEWEDGSVVYEDLVRDLSTTGKWKKEARVRCREGRVLWCLVQVSMFQHSSYGAVWVYVQEDITRRKQWEREIRLAKEAALQVTVCD